MLGLDRHKYNDVFEGLGCLLSKYHIVEDLSVTPVVCIYAEMCLFNLNRNLQISWTLGPRSLNFAINCQSKRKFSKVCKLKSGGHGGRVVTL